MVPFSMRAIRVSWAAVLMTSSFPMRSPRNSAFSPWLRKSSGSLVRRSAVCPLGYYASALSLDSLARTKNLRFLMSLFKKDSIFKDNFKLLDPGARELGWQEAGDRCRELQRLAPGNQHLQGVAGCRQIEKFVAQVELEHLSLLFAPERIGFQRQEPLS